MKIYLAGPLFSTAEVNFNNRLAAELRGLGHEVFLPQEQEALKPTTRAIFEANVTAINRADLVCGSLDGPDADGGTCWEIGYAYAKCKLIVVYRTDFRIFAGTDPISLMPAESAGAVLLDPIMSIEKLASAIHDEIDLLEARRAAGETGVVIGPAVAAIGAAGRPLATTPVYTHNDK